MTLPLILIVGLLVLGRPIIAVIMASMNVKSLWDTFAALMGLIGGGFPGIFALGLLTRRANTPGVVIGLLAIKALARALRGGLGGGFRL